MCLDDNGLSYKVWKFTVMKVSSDRGWSVHNWALFPNISNTLTSPSLINIPIHWMKQRKMQKKYCNCMRSIIFIANYKKWIAVVKTNWVSCHRIKPSGLLPHKPGMGNVLETFKWFKQYLLRLYNSLFSQAISVTCYGYLFSQFLKTVLIKSSN